MRRASNSRRRSTFGGFFNRRSSSGQASATEQPDAVYFAYKQDHMFSSTLSSMAAGPIVKDQPRSIGQVLNVL
jgi:hypothetical protein